MVDELLVRFQTELFDRYDQILASDLDPRAKIEAAVRLSFETIDQRGPEVAIFQNDAAYLSSFDRFGYLEDRNRQSRQIWMTLLSQGVASGALRKDLDIRSEEHTSELQSLMRNSYAVFCLKKKKPNK